MSLGQRLAALAFRAASGALSALPRSWTLGAAHRLAPGVFLVAGRRRRVMLENLACTSLGVGRSEAERRLLARRSLGHSLGLVLDLLTLPRVARNPERYCEIGPESERLLLSAAARGRGVILVASHFGLMESMGLLLGGILGKHGHRLNFVAKGFSNPWLDEAIRRRRGATGNRTIYKGGAKAALLESLERRELAAIVLDQHVAPSNRLWIPFLGLPAATARSLGTVAIETRAPVLPIHSFPLEGGRCRVECGPLLAAPSTGDDAADAEALVALAVKAQEAAVLREPMAWNWVHRRWKVRPDESLERYPSYCITESEELRRRQALE